MEDVNLLASLGITNWEAKTYLALIELGSTTTGPLVNKCEVPQSKIYSILESLNKKGLASYIIKGKTKYFQAADPSKIATLFKEKEKKINTLLSALKQKQAMSKQSTELYEGFKSIRNMLVGLIGDSRHGEQWYGFGPGVYEENVNEFYEWWGPRRESTGLKSNLLISKKNKEKFRKGLNDEDLKEIKKFTRYSDVYFPGDVFIYKNHVVILDWNNPPTAILITSENLAKQYLEFFKGLWKTAKP